MSGNWKVYEWEWWESPNICDNQHQVKNAVR
jgi:hypothetical protein